MRPGGHRVHPGSLGSLWRTLGVIGLITGRWVQWDSPLSSGFVRLIAVRLSGNRVHPLSLDSLGCALGVVGFILGRLIFWDASRGSSGLSEVARFIEVRPGGRCVLLVSRGSLECALRVVWCRCVHWGATWGSSDSFAVVGLILVRSGGLWVHSGSQGSLGCPLVSSVSSRVAGFNQVRPGGRSGSLGSLWCALMAVGFIRGRWVY